MTRQFRTVSSRGRTLAVCDDERETLVLLFPASDPRNFEVFPSEVLYRAAIQWGIDAGYARCDFGETTPDFEDGTFAFKTAFGGRLSRSATGQ